MTFLRSLLNITLIDFPTHNTFLYQNKGFVEKARFLCFICEA